MWPSFHGEAILLHFDEIKAPMSVVYGGIRTKTVDQNYSWLQLFPCDPSEFVLTAMFDNRTQLVQCYFDIVNEKGQDQNGVLWFDDLYLDLILFPNHQLFLVDEDELNEALDENIITAAMQKKAWRTAHRLMRLIKQDPDFFLDLVRKMRATFSTK